MYLIRSVAQAKKAALNSLLIPYFPSISIRVARLHGLIRACILDLHFLLVVLSPLNYAFTASLHYEKKIPLCLK